MCLLLISVPAMAYVGPGAGLTLIGSLFGLVVAVLFVLFGIISWPLRMLWKHFFAKKNKEATPDSSSGGEKNTTRETEK